MEGKLTQDTGDVAARRTVEAILQEIFTAYQEAGSLYAKATNQETRRMLLDMKRCFDLAITLLSPLDAPSEDRLENLRAQFPNS